jgi:hypothetical protein
VLFTVLVPPGAPGLQFEVGGATREEAVHHRDAGVAVPHGQLLLEHHLPEPIAPAGQAVDKVETFKQQMSLRGDGAVGPLVHAQPGTVQDGIQRDQANHPLRGRRTGHHQ